MTKLQTRAIHVGEPRIEGAVSMPIFQSSTFVQEGASSYDDVRYIRLNNTPNHEALHAKLASLDGAEDALVTASGMAAITTVLMTVVDPGDHVLIQRGLYGGTFAFFRHQFERQGIAYTLVDSTDPASWEAARRESTVALYLETLANPTLEVARLDAAAAFCRQHGLLSIVDNTFASPVNCRPIELGFDLCVQSASKYLNGHSDLVAGVVTGGSELVKRVRSELNHWGGTLDPHACFLLQRGLKTLALRVRQQNETAHRLAHFLEDHPAVRRVNYPTLGSHPDHAYAREHLEGCGGVLSFELQNDLDPTALVAGLRLAIYAPSLGGPETLVIRPAVSSHAGMTPEEREAAGVSDALVRVSVGLEHPDDVLSDFEQALAGLSQSPGA